MSDNEKCKKCGCMYWYEPDIGAAKDCNFPFFDYDAEQEHYKRSVCWAEQGD